MSAWNNLHAEFVQLARVLGADERLDLRVDSTLIHLEQRTGSKGALMGARFRLEIAKPIAPYPILMRRERGLDRAGKNLGINREVQIGDELFDKDVYIETDGQDEDVRRILGAPGVRASLRQILSWPLENITLGGDGIAESPLLPGANAIRLDIAPKHFTDVNALRGIVTELSRLARELSRGEEGPYRGDLAPRGAKPPAKTRTVRGVALSLVCVAVNLTGWYGVGFGSTPTFGWAAFNTGVVAGVVAWILFILVTVLLLRGRSTSLRNVIIFAFASVAIIVVGGRMGELLNATLDSSTPHAAKVSVRLRPQSKGGPRSEVTLLTTNDKVDVREPHRSAVAFTNTPQTADAMIGDGALGSPWLVQLVRLHPPAQPR